jgi:hypothetical protein
MPYRYAVAPRGHWWRDAPRVMAACQAPALSGEERECLAHQPPQDAIQRSLLAVRVPEGLLRHLETFRAKAQATQPYLRLSRAVVLRTLPDTGLCTAGA